MSDENPFTKELGPVTSVMGVVLDSLQSVVKDAFRIALDALGRVPTDGELQGLQSILDQLVREGRVLDTVQAGTAYYSLVPSQYFKVGDIVHYHFNGDSYPGKVERVSLSGHRVTMARDSGGSKVFSYRQDGRYRSTRDSTWTLYHGYLKEFNPSF